MFRMSIEMFWLLYDLLVSTYGLKSTSNVSTVESLAMFLYIVRGPQSFSHAVNQFSRSTWAVHMKFKEVLFYLRILAKDNIKPNDPSFNTEHAKVREDHFGLILKVLSVLYMGYILRFRCFQRRL
jgi:hypothetical protein